MIMALYKYRILLFIIIINILLSVPSVIHHMTQIIVLLLLVLSFISTVLVNSQFDVLFFPLMVVVCSPSLWTFCMLLSACQQLV